VLYIIFCFYKNQNMYVCIHLYLKFVCNYFFIVDGSLLAVE
jgi:hypothetical protein